MAIDPQLVQVGGIVVAIEAIRFARDVAKQRGWKRNGSNRRSSGNGDVNGKSVELLDQQVQTNSQALGRAFKVLDKQGESLDRHGEAITKLLTIHKDEL